MWILQLCGLRSGLRFERVHQGEISDASKVSRMVDDRGVMQGGDDRYQFRRLAIVTEGDMQYYATRIKTSSQIFLTATQPLRLPHLRHNALKPPRLGGTRSGPLSDPHRGPAPTCGFGEKT